MLSGKSTFFCVFSKVPEFLLVAFKLLEIHWAAFFFVVLRFVFEKKTYAKNPGSLAHMQCFAAFIVETNKRFLLFFIQQEISKTCRRENLGFCIRFFLKTKRKTAKKNAAKCISSNLKATSKNSGTFENTQKKVDFPLSIVFHQALQLLNSNK